jgi:hypothetical protein
MEDNGHISPLFSALKPTAHPKARYYRIDLNVFLSWIFPDMKLLEP